MKLEEKNIGQRIQSSIETSKKMRKWKTRLEI